MLGVAASVMLLASCAPRLADLAPPLQVELPTTCEDLLERIPLPAFGPNDDAIQAFLAVEAIVIEQHGVIELTQQCLRRQRLDYAGKGTK
ncbi:hypothetical protein [Bradyrhizobium sp. BR 10261]|uniref:hypothetical protein n=1 Tax=Bradyrhizobium sp. BR 10261 TaxID=2749992 RepID=UPI001C648C53|nr:hypothetical protein [Bradyrhizobium sp. BR 10261]MBW7965331.1 hypothetical protein [Bradyrhizobium sp. BR 10261]